MRAASLVDFLASHVARPSAKIDALLPCLSTCSVGHLTDAIGRHARPEISLLLDLYA
jgi:hypothetical protein